MSDRFGISEVIGVLLAIQGIGGTINNLKGDGPSWFLLNHIDAAEPYRLALHIAMAVVGGLLVLVPQVLSRRADRERENRILD